MTVYCATCGMTDGIIVSGNHSYSSNGYCSLCGYYNSAYDTSVCYHTSTYTTWSGCNWTKYCSNCGAYISSGASHGSTYTTWNGCNWYEYCRDCGQLMDSGTSHSYSYGGWEYYNSSRHRRTGTCTSCGATTYSYAEVKALCAGDDRIREKMNLDTDVSRLRLMKANHQSQQYRLEDSLLRTFPEQIEQNKGFIAGFDADMATLAAHPHPQDGFAGMEVKGDKLTDKDNAGAAIIEAFKDAKGLEPVPIGSYRGFAMSLTVEDFGKEFVLTLKGQMTHRVSLGKDAKGNLIRIDNALNGMAERRHNVEDKLANLQAQMAAAKAEIGKPFPQEDELKEKSARLAELNAELNIDDKTPMERMAESDIAKSARPSVLEKLKRPLPQRSAEKNIKQQEEER